MIKLRYRVGMMFVIFFLCAASVMAQAPSHERTLFQSFFWQEEEHEYAKIENIKGSFSDRGWQSLQDGYDGSRLLITMKDRMPQSATLEWSLKNYNPAIQSTSNREHLFFMTSSSDENERYYNDGSWFFLRTGTSYVNEDGSTSMKIDVGAKGVDTRVERFVFENKQWDVNETYRFKIIYDNNYIWVYFDDQLLITLDFPGQVKRFNQISFAGDGEYPSIAGPIFSDFSISTFDNEMYFLDKTSTTKTIGLGAPGYGGHGIAVGDVNGDGLEDLYLGNCIQNECLRDVLYIKQPDGTFRDETLERGVMDECCSHGVVFFDADNDGDLDLFNANTWEPNQLYINDGDGYFSEESEARGIEMIDGETRGAVAFDVNNDGFIDIFAANWGMQNEMYLNNGDGTFTREYRGAEGQVEDPEQIGTQGVTVSDIDNDGDYDIYISKRESKNELYLNTNGYLQEVARARGVDVGGRSDGATFADFDGDGDMDLFVSNTHSPNTQESLYLTILINDGNGYFQDQTDFYQLAMDGFTPLFFDANNDGHLDLYRLRNNDYHRTSVAVLSLGDGDGDLVSAGYCGATIIGADARSCVSHDFDADGDLDLYITTKLFENIYLENRSNIANNNWVEISTNGPNGDVGGIGSKIDVYRPGQLGVSAALLGHREVVTAQGYLSSGSAIQHFGLGDYNSFDVRVTLTDGSMIERQNVQANQRIVIANDLDYQMLTMVSGDNQTGYTQQILADPLVVRVVDQDDVPVPDKSVTFTVIQGQATLEPSASADTNTSGQASVSVRLGNQTGQVKINASVTGAKNSPVTFTARVEQATVELQKIGGDNQSGPVTQTLSHPLQVQANVVNGGPAADQSVTFSVVSGGGSLNGAASVQILTDAQGQAQIPWTLGTITGLQTVHATLGGGTVEFQATATPGAPHQISKQSGDAQEVIPGQAFLEPFAVLVSDVYGNPVPGVQVEFLVVAGGSLSGNSQQTMVTDNQGLASVIWTASPYVGAPHELHTTAMNSGTTLQGSPIVWTFPGMDIDPVQSTVTASTPVLADGVSTSDILVTLRDSQGATVGAGVSVEITVSGSDNTLSLSSPTTDASGRVRAYLSSIQPEIKTLTVTVLGLDLQLNDRPQVEFTSATQTPDRLLLISGDGQNAVVNQPVPEPLVVKVVDTAGQPVPNFDVEFVVTSGDASFGGQPSFTTSTNAQGMAQGVPEMGTTAGQTIRIEARAAGVSNSPIHFSIVTVAGEPLQLTIVSGNNQTGTAEQILPEALAVRVSDLYDNPVAGYPVTFQVNSGECYFDGATTKTVASDSLGVAQTRVTLGTEQGQSIVEAKTDVSSVTFVLNTSGEKVLPDLARSTFTATSPILADGVSQSELRVSLVDTDGNPVPGIQISFMTTGEAVTFTQPDSITNAQGQLKAFASSAVPGECMVMAFVQPQNLMLEQRATINFVQNKPKLEIISGDQLTATVGQPAPELLGVKLSSQGIPMSDHSITFQVIAGGGHFGGATIQTLTTNSNGIAQVDYFMGIMAGHNIIRAMSPSVPDTSLTFTLIGIPDVATQLSKEAGDDQTAPTNSVLSEPLQVLVTDAYNNRVPNASVYFEAIDGGLIDAPQPVLSDSLGIATCLVKTGNRQGRFTYKASLESGAFVLFDALAENTNHPPNIISYLPAESHVSFEYGSRLNFEILQVFDRDDDPISYLWYLNDILVGNQNRLILYMSPAFAAENQVHCHVSDGLDTAKVTWTLQLATPVDLSSFTAKLLKSAAVQLNWRARMSASQQYDFYVTRSTSRTGPYERISQEVSSSPDGEHRFVDSESLSPGTYFYKVEAVNAAGHSIFYGPVDVEIQVPSYVALLQNYPNPFNPTTTFTFELPEVLSVRLVIYNPNGQVIRELMDGEMPAGRHTVVWDAKDTHGVPVPTGIYLYQLTAGDFSETKKLTFIK